MLREQFLNSVHIISVDREALKNVLQRGVTLLLKDHETVKEVRLFGSFARGDYTPESDLDLLIICRIMETPFLLRREIFEPYFRDIPFDVNLLVYTEAELERLLEEKNPFIVHVLKESIVLGSRE